MVYYFESNRTTLTCGVVSVIYYNDSYIIHKYLTLGSHLSTFCSVCVCVLQGQGGWLGAGDRQLQMTTAGVPPSFFFIWRRLVVIGGGAELMVQ